MPLSNSTKQRTVSHNARPLLLNSVAPGQVLPAVWRILLDAHAMGEITKHEDLGCVYACRGSESGRITLRTRDGAEIFLMSIAGYSDRGWMERFFFVKVDTINHSTDYLFEALNPSRDYIQPDYPSRLEKALAKFSLLPPQRRSLSALLHLTTLVNPIVIPSSSSSRGSPMSSDSRPSKKTTFSAAYLLKSRAGKAPMTSPPKRFATAAKGVNLDRGGFTPDVRGYTECNFSNPPKRSSHPSKVAAEKPVSGQLPEFDFSLNSPTLTWKQMSGCLTKGLSNDLHLIPPNKVLREVASNAIKIAGCVHFAYERVENYDNNVRIANHDRMQPTVPGTKLRESWRRPRVQLRRYPTPY